MIPFQFAGIFVCLLFAGWNLRRLARRQRPRWLPLLGVLLGALGAMTIFDPDVTQQLARLAGITRGADLLFYLVALAFLGSWFYFYQRLRSLSNAITVIVREMAIRFPQQPGGSDEPRDPER